jgi:carboxypeptidase-like protein
MLIIRYVLTLFFLFVVYISLSQEISGVVIEGKTNQPLEGASVYFNNTTIGVTTNSKGEFVIEFDVEINTPLIISFMGYETVIRYDFSTSEKMEIYLNESTNVLDEVYLTSKNDWPRELKLKEFRRNYLGETINGLASKIMNENDIVLRYNKKKKQLTASAKKPLIVKNENLEYLITANLEYFEVNYSYVSANRKILNIKNVYYLGNNFYKTLQVNPTKSTIKKRKDTYLGSPLHFMRAMASEDLEREKYKIYKGSYPVKPKKYITVTPIDNLNNVKVELKDKLNILFQGDKLSYIKSVLPEFYIDNFGNYSPPKAVIFGGDLGKKRMGDALPLDFLLKNKSLKNN